MISVGLFSRCQGKVSERGIMIVRRSPVKRSGSCTSIGIDGILDAIPSVGVTISTGDTIKFDIQEERKPINKSSETGCIFSSRLQRS